MKKSKSIFKPILIAVTLLVGIMTSSCLSSSTNAGVVGADRTQLMLYSEAEMNQAAQKQYSEVIAEARAAGTLNTNQATYNRVQTIANKLIAQSPAFRSDALGWQWEVNVITESTVNAWCMPGGKIVVYTGIINALKLTDGELAAVMGHEISHALKEHSREQASQQALTQLGITVASTVIEMDEWKQTAIGLATQYGLTLPFSRSNENEADKMGTELMARAGYDPYEAVNVWKKMSQLSSSSVPEFMSTHPSHETRINNLEEIAKLVYPLYEEAIK